KTCWFRCVDLAEVASVHMHLCYSLYRQNRVGVDPVRNTRHIGKSVGTNIIRPPGLWFRFGASGRANLTENPLSRPPAGGSVSAGLLGASARTDCRLQPAYRHDAK